MAVERRLLIDAFALLQKSISPVIDGLTSELYSVKLIGIETRDNDQGSSMDKARRVLSAVESSIETNSQNYYIFEETLKQYPTLDDVVSFLVRRKSELEKSLLAPHQVEDLDRGNINSRSQCIAPHYTGSLCTTATGLHTHRSSSSLFLLRPMGTPGTDQLDLASMISELQLHQNGETGIVMAINSPPEVGMRDAALVRLPTPTQTEALPLASEDNPVAPFHRNMSEGEALKDKDSVVKVSTCGQMKPIQEEQQPGPRSPSFLDVPIARDVTDSLCSIGSSISSYSSQTSTEDDEWEELVQMQEKALKLYKQTKKNNKTLAHKLKRMEKRLKCTQGKERKLREELEQAHARDDEKKKLVEELKLTQDELQEKTKQHDKLLEEIASKEAQIQTLKNQLELTANQCEKLKDNVRIFMEKSLDERRSMLSYKQKYEQLKNETSNNYYELYREAVKESEQLHHQLMECQKANARLEQQIDYLLESSEMNCTCERNGCSQDFGADSQLVPD